MITFQEFLNESSRGTINYKAKSNDGGTFMITVSGVYYGADSSKFKVKASLDHSPYQLSKLSNMKSGTDSMKAKKVMEAAQIGLEELNAATGLKWTEV